MKASVEHRGGGANEWRGQPAGGILEQASTGGDDDWEASVSYS